MASTVTADSTSTRWPRVLGQQRVKNILISAIRAKRLPHAYLFYGQEGVGKDAAALEFARVLQCDKAGEASCSECASCWQVASLQHPETHFVCALPVGKNEKSSDGPLDKLTLEEVQTIQEEYRKKAANPYYKITVPRATVIKINSIREIRRESALSIAVTKKKIFIISRAEDMGEEASNTLLKTLEEPNPHTILILTTARRDSLLPTILSRCQNVRFDRLSDAEIRDGLMSREEISDEQATIVSRLADGSYSKALTLLDEDLSAMRQEVLGFIRQVLGNNILARLQAVEQIASSRNREKVTRFLTFMLIWFRDALVLHHQGTIVNIDQQGDIESFVQKMPQADLLKVLDDVENAISLVKSNVYITLVLLQLTSRLRKHILTPLF